LVIKKPALLSGLISIKEIAISKLPFF